MRIGIDLGGTHTAAAIVDESGSIIKRAETPTDISGGAETVIAGLLYVCGSLMGVGTEVVDHYDPQPKIQPAGGFPQSIGIGVPGTVDAEKGEVIFAPNLPLKGVNITRELQKKYACPVRLGNDANCAALGETVAGGAKGAKDVVLITLGTGIGGGIIIGGNLHTGVSGAAGELGHMVITAGGRQCGCGRKGCWETYASASGLKKTADEIMKANADSLLWKLCDSDAEKVNGRIVFEAYRGGDGAAREIVEQYIEQLAAGIANLINILEPEMICVGGGISNEWESISKLLLARVDAERFPRASDQSPQTRIVRATLGNDAGIIGAAML